MVIVVAGILASIALQSMNLAVEDVRRVRTKKEMDLLAEAIVGNPSLTDGNARSDFGYVGDVGAFPTSLVYLRENPGGYSTWDGPYLPPTYAQDTVGFRMDEWGKAYAYTGGITITSTGGGSTLSRRIADATDDYLRNTFLGTVADGSNNLPGSVYDDSVLIEISIPNGVGGTVTKSYHPDSTGHFTIDSLPVGRHPLLVVFEPNADTLYRHLTILPRHRSSQSFLFASAYFSSPPPPTGGCTGGTETLRPNGLGWLSALVADGATFNWQCVDETVSDEDVTRVRATTNSYRTDAYAIVDPSADTTCDVISVTVYCRAMRTHTQGRIQPVVYVSSTAYTGTAFNLTGSYADYNHTWSTNPATGNDWTWQEIRDLQAGLSMHGQNASHPAYCTQVWVEVQYGP